MAFLKPARGLRVLFERGGPMPAKGAEVEMTQYYRRRVADGDLEIADPPAARRGKEPEE